MVKIASELSRYQDIQIELVHIFGTPQSLAQYGDADILIARGMTYDWLRNHFPQKHVIEVRFSSFDIFFRCRFPFLTVKHRRET